MLIEIPAEEEDDGIHASVACSWSSFGRECFGTGAYTISTFTPGSRSELKLMLPGAGLGKTRMSCIGRELVEEELESFRECVGNDDDEEEEGIHEDVQDGLRWWWCG